MAHIHMRPRAVIGVFIVVIGLLALLEKLNLFQSFSVWHFWPLVFVAAGFLKIQSAKVRSATVLGFALIALGVIMTLNLMGIINVSLHDWWPVLLIAIGGYIIFKGRNAERDAQGQMLSDNSFLDITVMMGGNKTVCKSQNFKFGDITAVMGGVELDLRGASMESEAVLDVWATWGGIIIWIPADWTVVNKGTALMGGIEDKTTAAPGSNKRLILTGTAIMGGVEIKN
jgi:predicted membrane protein